MALKNLSVLAVVAALMQPMVVPVQAAALQFKLPGDNEAESEGHRECKSGDEKLDLSVGLLSLQYKGLQSLIEDQKKEAEALVDQCPSCSKKTLTLGWGLFAAGSIGAALAAVGLLVGNTGRQAVGIPFLGPASLLLISLGSSLTSAVGFFMAKDHLEAGMVAHPMGAESDMALKGSRIPRDIQVPGRQGLKLDGNRLLSSVKNYLLVSDDQRKSVDSQINLHARLDEHLSGDKGLDIAAKLRVPFQKIAYLSGEAAALRKVLTQLQIPCRYKYAFMPNRSVRPTQVGEVKIENAIR